MMNCAVSDNSADRRGLTSNAETQRPRNVAENGK